MSEEYCEELQLSEPEDERGVNQAGEMPLNEDALRDVSASEAEVDEVLTAQQLAERNALARVFDDVRVESANSSLVQPERWAALGLVPDHLSADEFEMFVYEYLEEDRAERERTAVEQEPASVFRTATRAVGVPMMFRKNPPEEMVDGVVPDGPDEGNSEQAEQALCSGERGELTPLAAPDHLGASENTAQVTTDAEKEEEAEEPAAEQGRDGSLAAGDVSSLGTDNPFAGLTIPGGYALVELEGEYVLMPTDEEATPIELTIECENIAVLTGAHSYYVYDRGFMTDTYAHWAFLAAEDNRVVTFADCVREDSRVYPRPLAATSLENPPFSMTAEHVAETWEIIQESGEFPDLGKTVASNGDVYYYSTEYLSHTYAKALAEWDAVERKMNY